MLAGGGSEDSVSGAELAVPFAPNGADLTWRWQIGTAPGWMALWTPTDVVIELANGHNAGDSSAVDRHSRVAFLLSKWDSNPHSGRDAVGIAVTVDQAASPVSRTPMKDSEVLAWRAVPGQAPPLAFFD